MKLRTRHMPTKKHRLDLKELERKLDKALEKETKESLTEWLMDKRKNENR